MRNEIAEWVLSQAAPPEQAATIVGDLLEAQPGPVAFWVAVLRATASIASQPRRVLRGIFWFAYDISFSVCWGWFLMRMPKLGLLSFVILSILWVGVASLIRSARKNVSLLSFPLFFFVLEKYCLHTSTAFAVVAALWMLVFDGWMRWRKWRKSQTSLGDRPVAG